MNIKEVIMKEVKIDMKEVTIIKDDEQYESYRTEIRRLYAIDPSPDSEDGKTLAHLFILVEKYEMWG